VAAVTTSLPEVVGHERNYDYRYVWLRDAGMVASTLARIGTESEGPRFLEFLSSTHGDLSAGEQPLAPLVSVVGSEAPREEWLHLAGWGGSRPVRIGNSATAQLQLDAYANLLFAAQAIFDRSGRIPQWPVIEKAAQFLAVHWRDSEAGIWEENASLQHTSSKAIVACGLSYMAAHAPDPEMAAQWMRAVGDIQAFVARSCLTPATAPMPPWPAAKRWMSQPSCFRFGASCNRMTTRLPAPQHCSTATIRLAASCIAVISNSTIRYGKAFS